ncbi:MAG: hypothetical protein WCJ62_13720, partial [Flavobacterium sp.]
MAIISQRYAQGGLVAPNGKRSNLTPKQYKLVRSEAFLNWFGDWINDPDNASKVVDENGEPLVVYHGTNNNFTEFNLERVGSNVDYGMWGSGFYFSPSKSFSKHYGNKILKLFLNIRNPFVRNPNLQGSKSQFKPVYGKEESLDLRNEILSYNYDGVFQYNSGEKNALTQIVAFEPNQIKLADGTNSLFDPNNDDVRFENGGEIDFTSTKSINIKINNDLYKVQYQRGERGDTEKNVWFANVISKNNEKIVGRLCEDPVLSSQIYGYNLKEVENDIFNSYMQNELYLIIEDDYGNEKEIIHIEVPEKSKYEKGGRTIAQTPSPKKDRVYGSDLNKSNSSKDLSSAKLIKFDENTIDIIKNKVSKHNEDNPNKKINLASAKAVVRRGMGAYSKSHRPTITDGKPNSRLAWGLARLNAFMYKIVNGKSKSGKYHQDDDLIEELGYKVAKYKDGGEMNQEIKCRNCGWEWNTKDSEEFDKYVCHRCGFDNQSYYSSDPI